MFTRIFCYQDDTILRKETDNYYSLRICDIVKFGRDKYKIFDIEKLYEKGKDVIEYVYLEDI
jgi:hypothetical protein